MNVCPLNKPTVDLLNNLSSLHDLHHVHVHAQVVSVVIVVFMGHHWLYLQPVIRCVEPLQGVKCLVEQQVF